MSGSLEEAYVAVERAYGQGDFTGALQLAEALRPQVPAGRPDLLDQRLQLLLGHIHLYGLNQPAQAMAAYTAVLEGCAEPSYRELAGQGLEISRQQMPVAAEAEPPASQQPAAQQAPAQPATGDTPAAAAGQALPATPWLNQLQDPQQALRQIQETWGTTPSATAAPAAAAGSSAAPWQPGGAASAPTEEAAAPAAAAMEESASAEPGGAPAEAEETSAEVPAATPEAAAAEPADLVVQSAEPNDAEPEDPQAIIPVVVTVEEEATPAEPEPTPEAPEEATAAAPEVPAANAFSEEEWADFKRGLLLVELTTSNAGPTR